MLTLFLLILPLVWFFTDTRSLKEKIKVYFRLKSILFLLAEVLLIFGVLFSRFWLQTPIDNLIITIGRIVFFTGIILAVWAKIVMKSNWGMPGEYNEQMQKKIVKDGPFSLSRNPIYLGLILVFLGYALAFLCYMILVVPIIVLYFYKQALKEEKILEKHFGEEYLQYKSKVSRFI